MLKKHLVQAALSLPLLFGIVEPAYATNLPNFSTCLNPQGSVSVSYDSGYHGVAGSTNQYQGSDIVYQLSDNALMQCLCPDNGEGVQTNWLKASNLSQSDINDLKSQGW